MIRVKTISFYVSAAKKGKTVSSWFEPQEDFEVLRIAIEEPKLDIISIKAEHQELLHEPLKMSQNLRLADFRAAIAAGSMVVIKAIALDDISEPFRVAFIGLSTRTHQKQNA